MAQFTRRQLRNYVNDTSNFSGDRDFSLVNNLSTTAYFNIEGVNSKDIFNTASLTSLVNCSVITESMHKMDNYPHGNVSWNIQRCLL